MICMEFMDMYYGVPVLDVNMPDSIDPQIDVD